MFTVSLKLFFVFILECENKHFLNNTLYFHRKLWTEFSISCNLWVVVSFVNFIEKELFVFWDKIRCLLKQWLWKMIEIAQKEHFPFRCLSVVSENDIYLTCYDGWFCFSNYTYLRFISVICLYFRNFEKKKHVTRT